MFYRKTRWKTESLTSWIACRQATIVFVVSVCLGNSKKRTWIKHQMRQLGVTESKALEWSGGWDLKAERKEEQGRGNPNHIPLTETEENGRNEAAEIWIEGSARECRCLIPLAVQLGIKQKA